MCVDVIILTCSSKIGGRCVAGIDNDGNWVRLVSNDQHSNGAIPRNMLYYENGGYCQPLDVVRVPIIGALPSVHQPENILVDRTKKWRKLGVSSLDRILQLHPAEHHTLIYGSTSPFATESDLSLIHYSLILIEVSSLRTYIVETTNGPRTRASFLYNGHSYSNISVTDPDYFDSHRCGYIGNSILVISIPDEPIPPEQYYKFIAKIY